MSSLVTADWLLAQKDERRLIILDVSPPKTAAGEESDLAGQFIPGAFHVDVKTALSDTTSDLPNTIPKPESFEEQVRKYGINQEDTVIVYDNFGIYMSPRVWWLFKMMGHDNVFVLDGGLPAWVKAGGKTDTKPVPVDQKGNFKAKYNPSLFKSVQHVLDNLETREALVLDARSSGRFHATVPEPRAGLRSGHIPNSESLPYKQLLQNGNYKSKDELRQTFNKLNPEERPMIFSCGSGVTACVLYLAAEEAGFQDLAVYDGSWTEWGGGDYPIE